jgi:effector-binding domain-containing protein
VTHEVGLAEVVARPLAVARGATTRAALGPTIIRLLDLVWPVLREQGVPTGHNVVMYLDDLSHIEAGVEVFGDFRPTDDGVVSRSATPAGLAATAVHWGEYSEMSATYTALRRWCVENGHELAGPSWEVYGDWHADPQQLRTDIFLLLGSTPEGSPRGN